MSADGRQDEFEQRLQGTLDESVTRVSGHARSRLNQARQAALAEIAAHPRRSFWRLPALMPAASAVAAAVVAIVLITRPGGEHVIPGAEGGIEDVEMLSDNDGLELLENFDGSFYEWAASQSEESDVGASG